MTETVKTIGIWQDREGGLLGHVHHKHVQV